MADKGCVVETDGRGNFMAHRLQVRSAELEHAVQGGSQCGCVTEPVEREKAVHGVPCDDGTL